MEIPNPFKMQRLTITPKRRRNSNEPPRSFEAMFNPSQYSLTYRNKVRHHRTLGPDAGDLEFAGQEPASFQVRLMLDGTGATESFGLVTGFGLAVPTVKEKVNQFLTTCYRVVEDEHQPNVVHLQWGIVDFYGQIESLQINFTLFDQSGNPLRAELDVRFVGHDDHGFVNLSSPDLTHVRVTKAGDSLPLLAKEIYGSSRYYLLIADANGLDDFRNLQPGTVLHFPPLTPQ